MTDTYLLQALSGLHILSAAVFVGSNVLVEILIQRFELIPPGEAATISGKLGIDLAVLNGIALIVVGGTGFARLYVSDMLDRLGDASFWTDSYGLAMACMIGLWLTVVVAASLLIYLRPRAVAKLPFDATREEVAERSDASMQAQGWMRRLGQYNLAAGIVLILVGGFLRYGGFVWETKTALPAAKGNPAAGRIVFIESGCGSCHALAATGAQGTVGPNLDQVKLTAAEIFNWVRNGKGAMPSYKGQLSQKELADLAAFLAK